MDEPVRGARAMGGKRLFDVLVAAVLILLLAPVMVLIALVVLVDVGWPVLFVQERPGLHGRPFRLYKFRTMRGQPGTVDPATDGERMTRVGRWLRRWSLDELPELWNVLRGDMSLVGPRPLLMEYLPLYTARQARRQEVRPGLTGWAQVNGRNALSWPDRFELDVWYVDNWSFGLDLKIMVRTVVRVLSGEGVSAEGEATVSKFTGEAS